MKGYICRQQKDNKDIYKYMEVGGKKTINADFPRSFGTKSRLFGKELSSLMWL